MGNIITDYINTVENCRVSLKDALEDKHIAISTQPTIQECTQKAVNIINSTQISTSEFHRVRFFDADGTLLKEEYVANGGTATPPTTPNVDPEYLTFRCWASVIGNIFTPIEHDVDYGACYLTNDNATYIFITLTENTGLAINNLSVTSYRKAGTYGSVYIDWGDGSTPSSWASNVGVNSGYSFSHTYSEYGSYVIKAYAPNYPQEMTTATAQFSVDGRGTSNPFLAPNEINKAITKIYLFNGGRNLKIYDPNLRAYYTNYQWGLSVSPSKITGNDEYGFDGTFILPPVLGSNVGSGNIKYYISSHFKTYIVDKSISYGTIFFYPQKNKNIDRIYVPQNSKFRFYDLTNLYSVEKYILYKDIGLSYPASSSQIQSWWSISKLKQIQLFGDSRSINISALGMYNLPVATFNQNLKSFNCAYNNNVYKFTGVPDQTVLLGGRTLTTSLFSSNASKLTGTPPFWYVEDFTLSADSDAIGPMLYACPHLKNLNFVDMSEINSTLYIRSGSLSEASWLNILNLLKDLTGDTAKYIYTDPRIINQLQNYYIIYDSLLDIYISADADMANAITIADAITNKNWTITENTGLCTAIY